MRNDGKTTKVPDVTIQDKIRTIITKLETKKEGRMGEKKRKEGKNSLKDLQTVKMHRKVSWSKTKNKRHKLK